MDVSWAQGSVEAGSRASLAGSYDASHDPAVTLLVQVYASSEIDASTHRPSGTASPLGTVSATENGDGTGFTAKWTAKSPADGSGQVVAFAILSDESQSGLSSALTVTEPAPKQSKQPETKKDDPPASSEPEPNQSTPEPNQSTDPGPQQSTDPGPQQSTDPEPNQSTPEPNQSTDPGPQQSTDPGPQQSTDPGPQQSTDPGPQQSTDPGDGGTEASEEVDSAKAYYYPPDERPSFGYKITVKPPPADDAKVFYHQGSEDGPVVATDPLVLTGSSTIDVDLKNFTASADSPIFLEFYMKKGEKEQRALRAVALAAVAPGIIDVPATSTAGGSVTLKVSSWAAIVFDTQGQGTAQTESEPGRVPSSVQSDVRWRVAGNDVADKGQEVTVTLPSDASGSVPIEAYLPATQDHKATGSIQVAAAPQVAKITPAQGPVAGGTNVTIEGQNLTNVTSVQLDGQELQAISGDGGTKISGTTPAHAEGAVDVVLKGDPSGDVTVTGGFVYLAVPSVTIMDPASGPTTGGTAFTLKGQNLGKVTSVEIDGVAVTDLQTGADGASITGTTPVHAKGPVDVVLKGDPSGDVTLSAGYGYVAVPVFTTITPAKGSCGGGTDITIDGTDLGTVTSVEVGGAPITGFAVNADGTQILGKTASHDPATTDVVLKGDPHGDVTATGAYTYAGIDVKGVLFYNRGWDYNTSGARIPAAKILMVDVEIEFLTKATADADFASAAKVFTDSTTGAFLFQAVDKKDKAKLRINLKHRGDAIVSVEGRTLKSGNATPFSETDFEVKNATVVWHRIDVDPAKTVASGVLDLGEVEVTHTHFRSICDAFYSVRFGHERMKSLVGVDLPICKILYPEEVISNAGDVMSLQKDDCQDRDVILHEYGHFIGQKTFAGGLKNPGYDYNNNVGGNHAPGKAGHYENAWIEGHATFLSCALQDDPIYRDGYDSNTTFHLDTDNNGANGAHDEGAVQEALWNALKVQGMSFKDGFWKAFSGGTAPTTIYEFLDNFTAAGASDKDKLIAGLKTRGMEYGYKYVGQKSGTKWKAAAAFNAATNEFSTMDELFTQFGSVAGEDAATSAARKTQYMMEFHERNKKFNAGQLAAASTNAAPAVTAGNTYIIPQRFKI